MLPGGQTRGKVVIFSPQELSSSGQLCVRTKAGLVPMLDFLKQHGYVKPPGGSPCITASGGGTSWEYHERHGGVIVEG